MPLVSIVRDWSTTNPKTPLLLVHSARTWEDLVFRDELLDIAAREPLLTFIAATTHGPRHRPEDFDRRLDRRLLRDALTRWAQSPRVVFVCGSNDFVEAVATGLAEESVPPARICTERYGGKN